MYVSGINIDKKFRLRARQYQEITIFTVTVTTHMTNIIPNSTILVVEH